MIQLRIFVLFLLASGSVPAQSPTAADFNSAWQDYQAAKTDGDKDDIVDAAARALEIGEALLGADDERVAMLMSNYGTALFEAGNQDEALDVLKRSVERTEAIHGDKSPEMIPVLMNYADAQAKPNESRPMARSYDSALKLARDLYGEKSLDYAGISLRAGLKIIDTGDTRVANRYIRKANDLFMELVGPGDVRTAFAQMNLGKFELSARDYDDAIEHFLVALEGFDDGSESSNRYELSTRAFLVQAYEANGMSEEATEHCLAIGARSMIEPDQEYLPLYRKAPAYPRAMLISNRSGHVDVSFTVDASGFVRDANAIDVVGGEGFRQAALDAVAEFRYAPRFQDGKPVTSENVKTRITFSIEE